MPKRVEPKMTEREQKAFAYWKRNPVECVKDWFKVTPEDYQADILMGTFVGDKDRIAAKSAHGTGKTTTLSWCGWLFLNFNKHSRLVATAPTFPQLHDVLWPEYAKWHLEMPDYLRSQWDISGNHIRHTYPEWSKTWFAVSRTSNKPSNLQGFHNSDIMIQVDEASGVEADVFEVIEGIMSNAEEHGQLAILQLMGNPNFTAGELYHAFNKNKDLYTRYTLSGDDEIFSLLKMRNKNNGAYHKDHGNVYYSRRVTQKYRDIMTRKYGRDGGVYDVRVRGLFPRVEDKAIIPLAWAQAASTRDAPTAFDAISDGVTIVMDVAREGADETVLGVFRRGHLIKMKTWPKTSTTQCEDILVEENKLWKDRKVRVERIIIDEPGVGGGVVDNCRRANLAVTPYHGGESLKKDKDPEEDIRMFVNRRARDYWNVRRKFERGEVCILDDETTVNQLASVRYDYNRKTEKIQVESKTDMRSRLGDDASPDRADVIVMGLAPWYSFQAGNTTVTEDDIIEGDDRPQADLDLF